MKSVIFLKLLCIGTKWTATVISLIGLIIAALFVFDLVTHEHWGYPWWLLPIMLGIAAVGWLLRREAAFMLQQLLEQEMLEEEF